MSGPFTEDPTMGVTALAVATSERLLTSHPAEPVGDQCPGCERVGLPENTVPRGARRAAVATIRRASR